MADRSTQTARVRGPLVSILTPSFNQARWLSDNLSSVAAQDYPFVEHIVKDGASRDESLEILRATAGPHVRWSSHPDQGQSDAINLAFGEASGEIIGWLNSDDAYFSSRAVSHAVQAFQRHPNVDVVYGHAVLVNAAGLLLHAMWAPPMRRRLLLMLNFIVQPTVFIRRSALEDRLVDPTFDSMMDRELWLRLSSEHQFLRLNRVLAIDRHQPNRKVITRPDQARREQLRLESLYGSPRTWSRRATKLIAIAFRLYGLACFPELLARRFAFAGYIDGHRQLLLRQVMVRRAQMPFESEPSKFVHG